MRYRLRVALEDRGQETILRYLEGNQIPQTKDDFLTGGKYFKAALDLAPDSVFDEARMISCQGRALIFDHAYGDARVLLERSIRLDPTHSYGYNALGISCLEQIATNQSTFNDAVRAFHDAIRFAPYWAYPRHNLALAYEQAGDYAAAERTYLEAIPLGRQYSYLYYNLAVLSAEFPLHGLSATAERRRRRTADQSSSRSVPERGFRSLRGVRTCSRRDVS